MRLIAFVTEAGFMQPIFKHLGEPTTPPRIAPPSRGPPLTEADFDQTSRYAPPQGEPLPQYELYW
ncbi:MAG: hypothetical protein M3461_09095 [Pseudomonadota bacterium]|nr:hypothetical protein [Pseudomonadota bacterium]